MVVPLLEPIRGWRDINCPGLNLIPSLAIREWMAEPAKSHGPRVKERNFLINKPTNQKTNKQINKMEHSYQRKIKKKGKKKRLSSLKATSVHTQGRLCLRH